MWSASHGHQASPNPGIAAPGVFDEALVSADPPCSRDELLGGLRLCGQEKTR